MIRRTSLVAGLTAALLAACGQGQNQGPSPSGSAAGPSGAPSNVAASGAPGGTEAPSGAPGSSSPPDAGAPDSDGGSGDAGASAAAAPEGMIEIPEGVFRMGSDSQGLPEERPQHEIAVARFFLDRTEVTTGAYKKCIADGKCKTTHTTTFCNEPHTDRDDHPINCVDWNMADAYCAAVGKRLPSEREWEYAARGGAEQRAFSWGDDPPTTKNACYQHGESCPVASFAAGAFGLFDMSGNVWEWTSSWFGPYPGELAAGKHKVYRGGSWSRRFPKWLRNGIRNRYLVDEFSSALGFRCARSIEPLTCPKEHAAKDGSCVRTSGQPWCEPGHPWNGKECSGYDAPGQKAPEKSPDEIAAEPVVKTRTPQHDEDCKTHYKGKPAAYRFSGNTFHARNPMIQAGGCTRRDMGSTWTSACCPN